jgi:hypothetical protein
MTLHTRVSRTVPAASASIDICFPYRPYEAPESNGQCACQPLGFSVTLAPNAGSSGRGAADLQAAVAFLVDSVHGVVPAETLARMIGCFFLATATSAKANLAISVSLANPPGDSTTVRVAPRNFAIERTAFGAAHILYEDDTLGLYILAIAPHGTIPAHCHRVMRERELILDDGLLQQGRPVARGNAYAWPLGYVHAYRNPTNEPRRILCIDNPRFMPADEVASTEVQSLVPLAPLTNYLT